MVGVDDDLIMSCLNRGESSQHITCEKVCETLIISFYNICNYNSIGNYLELQAINGNHM